MQVKPSMPHFLRLQNHRLKIHTLLVGLSLQNSNIKQINPLREGASGALCCSRIIICAFRIMHLALKYFYTDKNTHLGENTFRGHMWWPGGF